MVAAVKRIEKHAEKRKPAVESISCKPKSKDEIYSPESPRGGCLFTIATSRRHIGQKLCFEEKVLETSKTWQVVTPHGWIGPLQTL